MRRRRNELGGVARALAAALSASLLAPGVAAAQEASDVIGGGVQAHATTALAVLGITAVPNETASTLFLDSGRGAGTFDYESGQIFGGFTISDDYPIFFEGLIGGARYTPSVAVDGEDSVFPIKWTSVAATGGIGYDFKLTDRLSIRPIFNFSLGYVVSDATLLGKYLELKYDVDLGDALSDGMAAGGLGGSLMLEYNLRSEDYDVDITLRHTSMEFVPIAGSGDLEANASAISTTLWSRIRIPIADWRVMGNPVRSVWEASFSHLPGDQGKALNTEWLGQLGAGIELDSTDTWVPLVTRTRLVARYAFGEELEGYSLGLAVSF